MDMLDPFDPMNPFFQDEFIFRDEDGDGYCRCSCPDCGETVKCRSDADTVRCRHCGCEFDVD